MPTLTVAYEHLTSAIKDYLEAAELERHNGGTSSLTPGLRRHLKGLVWMLSQAVLGDQPEIKEALHVTALYCTELALLMYPDQFVADSERLEKARKQEITSCLK